MKTSFRALLTLFFVSIVLAFGAAYVGAGPGVQPGYPRPAGAVPTLATPAALAAYPTSGLTAGATAYVTNLGAFTYFPSCPTTCDGTLTCVTAAAADGGLGCWTRGPIAACLCPTWTIDPVNGSDTAAMCGAVQTGAEWSRRVAGCSVQAGMTLSLLSSMPPTDSLAIPNIGPPLGSVAGTAGAAARLVVDCRSGSTILYANDAGLADASPQSGNNPLYIIDNSINFLDAGPGGTSLVGYRFRDKGNVDGGANDGGVGWIVGADGGVAYLSQPLNEVLEDGGTGSILTKANIYPGDTYVIDNPPMIPSISFPASVSTAPYTQNGNLIFVGCSFGNGNGPYTLSTPTPDGGYIYSYQHVPNYGGPHDYYTGNGTVHFVSSYMGALGGTMWCEACSWANGFPMVESGDNTTILAGAMFGDVEIGSGGNAVIGTGSVCVGGNASCIWNRGSVFIDGQYSGGLGILNVGGGFAAMYIEPGGVVLNYQSLWGLGSAASGVKVRGPQAAIGWTNGLTPTLTGASDVIVGGTTTTWATIASTGVTTGSASAWVYK